LLLEEFLPRFAADLDRLSDPAERIGLAVSGGPDSLALLLLATAARPGRVEAATVDHGLRAESRTEAKFVADLCERLNVPHEVLAVHWDSPPASAIQERARERRYSALAVWLEQQGLDALATAHHRDDQAETLLMRLARGSGLRGLASMRPTARLPGTPDLRLLRPILGWSRDELADVCRAAGVTPIDDPSNADEQFERVRVRRLLAGDNVDAAGLARSADHLRSADEAIEWAVEREWAEAVIVNAGAITYLAGAVPDEIRRRLLARIIAQLATEGDHALRGREVDQLVAALQSGGRMTLRGVLCTGGATWRFEPAPGRTSACG
jgi:tRNA(Ile)-lysidine synthase